MVPPTTTQARPKASATAAATAKTAKMVYAFEEGDTPGLVVRERALPNRDPFTEGTVVMRDPSVTSLAFKYLTEDGSWVDTWNGDDAKTIPQAVQLRLGVTLNGRAQTMPAMTVTLRAAPLTQ